MHTHPRAVDEYLGGIWIPQGLVFLQNFHVPRDHEFHDGFRRRTHADVAQERKVLDQATRLAFRRLSRANQAPVGIVKLARLRELAITADGRVGSPQVR